MVDSNCFDNLDDIIQPTIERSNKIQVLLKELIPIEEKLSEFGITIELIFNHQTLNLDSKTEVDISSKEFQEATKLHFNSILAILQCQEVLGKFRIPMTE